MSDFDSKIKIIEHYVEQDGWFLPLPRVLLSRCGPAKWLAPPHTLCLSIQRRLVCPGPGPSRGLPPKGLERPEIKTRKMPAHLLARSQLASAQGTPFLWVGANQCAGSRCGAYMHALVAGSLYAHRNMSQHVTGGTLMDCPACMRAAVTQHCHATLCHGAAVHQGLRTQTCRVCCSTRLITKSPTSKQSRRQQVRAMNPFRALHYASVLCVVHLSLPSAQGAQTDGRAYPTPRLDLLQNHLLTSMHVSATVCVRARACASN